MILSSVALASEGRLVAVDDLGRVIQLGGVRYLNPADQIQSLQEDLAHDIERISR